MKGLFVIVIFVVINVIAFTIFAIYMTGSVNNSIKEQEQLSRDALDSLMLIYVEKNIASSNYLNAVSQIPKMNTYLLSTFSNYIDTALNIPLNESLVERPLTFQELQYTQSKIQDRINQFNNTARNYAVLRTNTLYIEARKYVDLIYKEELEYIKTYNEYVQQYNKLTSRVPSSIVAGFMGKFPFLEFETGTNITAKMEHIFE